MMRVLCVCLGLACLVSAVAMIYLHHLQRQLYVELTQQEQVREGLKIEFGRLQLEQATLGQSARVVQIASDTLHMTQPQATEIMVVKP